MTTFRSAACSMVAVFALSGCATKMFVRNRTEPLDTKVAELDDRSTATSTRLEGLEQKVDKDVSRLDERTLSAQTKADAAMDQAKVAKSSADDANSLAGEAHDMAESGLSEVESLNRLMEEMQSYELARQEAVLFDFNSSDLSSNAMATLGRIKDAIGNTKSYALVVQGFTDSTGASDYNIELSKRRADEVVRKLASTHAIPLYRIHQIGLGSEAPAGDNTTRAGRKQNRRVELKLFVSQAETPQQVGRLDD